MTYTSPLRTAFLFLALCVFPAALSAQEYEDIYVEALTLPLNAEDPEETEVGELIYRGGLRILPGADDILPGDDKIGRISSLEWHDGELWAVADDGRWMRMRTDESDAELNDIVGMDIGALRNLRGRKPRDKDDIDAEALTLNPQGDWMVAFEQDHRVWRYEDLTGPAQDEGQGPLTVFGPMIANKGIETMAGGPDGGLLCAERHTSGEANCARIYGRQVEMFELVPPPELAAFGTGPVPTDAACADDCVCYALMKAFDSRQLTGKAIKAAVIEVQPDNSQRVLAVLEHPLSVDNMEGLAVREQYGRRFLYLASDDNGKNNCEREPRVPEKCQHTLLMKFEIKSDEPPVPQVTDAPEPDPQYETTDVVLQTQMGDITIALEMERAPITAANFLRYVEEGRFDGTVFYRSLSMNREPKPNGLLQGGTQFDPKRILPGIEHEPTTLTELSHTNGAVSMAMGEPGTANGDFSIMLQDQSGLDARPEDPDPIWQNGYAVFGYVTDGMDVVAAIHQSGIDPDKGQPGMKGQMLAKPVEIVRAFKPEPQPTEDAAD